MLTLAKTNTEQTILTTLGIVGVASKTTLLKAMPQPNENELADGLLRLLNAKEIYKVGKGFRTVKAKSLTGSQIGMGIFAEPTMFAM